MKKLILLFALFVSVTNIKAQTCSSPVLLDGLNGAFSTLDSFNVQDRFFKFTAKSLQHKIKLYVKGYASTGNYYVKLYNNDCSNLATNQLSITPTVSGDSITILQDLCPLKEYLIEIGKITTNTVYVVNNVAVSNGASAASFTCPAGNPCPVSGTCELVCNGGFEHISNPVNNYAQLPFAYNWSNANTGDVDLFSSGTSFAPVGVPCNVAGYKQPTSATSCSVNNNYIGIFSASDPVTLAQYCEYAQTKLSSTLIAGKNYIISFYISKGQNLTGILDKISIFLTPNVINQTAANGVAITNTPAGTYTNVSVLNNTSGWTKLTFCYYSSSGGENYLTIGRPSTSIIGQGTFPTSFTCTAPNTSFPLDYYSYTLIDEVSVQPFDVIATASSPSVNVCGSVNLNLTFPCSSGSLTSLGYNWSGTGLSNSSIQNPVATLSTTSNYNIQVTGFDSNNQSCSANNNITITSNTLNPLTLSSSAATICPNSTVSITGSLSGGTGSYTYSPGGNVGNNIVFSPSVTTTYTVSGTGTSGCIQTKTITIYTYTSTVTASASPTVICTGFSSTLTGSNGSGFTWQPGLLGGTSVVVSPTVTTTYTVTGTTSNGCVKTNTVVVTVNNPSAISISPATSNSICLNSSINLVASGALTYTWQPGNVVNSNNNVTPSVTTIYTVSGTNSFGCVGTKTASVFIYSLPTVNCSVTTPTICPNISTTLSASGASTYTWSPGNIIGSSAVISPSVTTAYTVTGTSALGCTNSCVVTQNVYPATANFFTVTATPSVVCNQPPYNYPSTITVTGISNYTLSPPVTVNAPITTTANGTYSASATYTNGCVYTKTVSIIYTDEFAAIYSATICPTETLNLNSLITQTNTSGATYSVNGTASTNTVGSLSVGNYTVTYTYTAGILCQNTATTIINVSGSCCTSTIAAFTSSAFPTTTLGGITYTTPIVFNHDVTIPSGMQVTLSDAEYLFAPNVKIIVSPNAHLALRGSHLYGCGTALWQGVVVQDGGKVSTTLSGFGNHVLVEDAITAIDVTGNTTSSVNPILSINRTTFNKNYIGIKIDSYQQNVASYPFSITECVFTSRSLTFSPTSWPTTSASSPGLRYANTSTTALTPPYALQSATITNLKNPYSSQSALTGVLINNAGLSAGNNYTDVVVGSASNESNFNLFDALIYGIDATNSNVSSLNNAFQNSQRLYSCGRSCGYSGGDGIRSIINSSLNARLNLTASGTYSTSYSVGNRFWDCYKAVEATNVYELDCNYATFRSTQTSTAATSTSFFPGNTGIINSTNRFSHTIRYNNFANISNPVAINVSSGTYTYGATTYTGILANNLFVDYNYFGAQITNTTSIVNEFVNSAVTFGSATTAGWNYIGTVGLRIQSNTFDRVWRGASVSAFAYPVFVQTNTVNLVNDATINATQYGIYCGNLPYVNINTNTLNAVNTTNTLVTLVKVAASPTCAVTCNTLNTAYQGFVFDQNSAASAWKGNSMTSHARGMVLTNTAVIGTQGSSGSPSDNKWNGSTWTGTNVGTFVDGTSTASTSILWVKISAGFFPPNPGYVSGPLSYSNTANTPTTNTGSYSCGGGGGGGRIIIPPHVNPGQASAKLINAIDPMQYTSDNILYRFLANNDSLRNSDSAYIDFYNSQAGNSMDLFNQTESALSSGQITLAQSINNSITSNNTSAANYKSYYSLYAKYQNVDFSQTDSAALYNLAQQCPSTDGTIVYQARTLYNLINSIVLIFNDNCVNNTRSNNGQESNRLTNGMQANNWSVDLFPNPTTGELNIVSKIDAENLLLIVKDLNGGILHQEHLQTRNFISKLDINLISGLYLITIINNKNESTTKKLVITK